MKLILSTILLFVVVTCINACSKDTHNNAAKTSDPSNITATNTLIETAIVNTIIDPITIEVLQDDQKMIVQLIGLSLPENKRSSQIHQSALNFTKFHLHKGKEVKLQKDIYSTNSEFHWRYLFIDGEMYNKLMLSNGHAVLWSIHEKFELIQEFQSIEQNAQDSHLGYWSYQNEILNSADETSENSLTNEPAGTLPKLNLTKKSNNKCDYTSDNIPIIKGNYDKKMKVKTYYLPDSIFYKTIDINEVDGDKLFCTENEAEINGWVKSKH